MNRAPGTVGCYCTTTELVVLRAAWDGPGAKEWAHRLGMKKKTLRWHIANIAQKLPPSWYGNVATQERVARFAIRQGNLDYLEVALDRRATPREAPRAAAHVAQDVAAD